MTSQEKDKLIFEALGECWHVLEPDYHGKLEHVCQRCGKLFLPRKRERFFTTWEGFGRLWEQAQKMEWWQEFRRDRGLCTNSQFFLTSLINRIRFRDALAEFLERRKK